MRSCALLCAAVRCCALLCAVVLCCALLCAGFSVTGNQIVPIVMKPGSLDSSGDVEYYGFYSFALLVFEIFNF